MIAARLLHIFLPDEYDRRPVFGGTEKFQSDPHWRDYLLFYEYFHGEDGSGLGASHQTGWTGALAALLTVFGSLEQEKLTELGMHKIPAILAAAGRILGGVQRILQALPGRLVTIGSRAVSGMATSWISSG